MVDHLRTLSKAQLTKRKGDFVIGSCERMWLEVVVVVSRRMSERAEETHVDPSDSLFQ